MAEIDLEKVRQSFKDLFDRAKAKDEFEYCCALLRIKGSEGPGWDPLAESYTLLTQSISLINSPVFDKNYRMRLLLLVYCHTVEMNFIYDMIANMIQISDGEQYCTNWFEKENGSFVKVGEKIDKIKKFAKKNNQTELVGIVDQIFLRDVRNAFNHADYILYENNMRINETGKVHAFQDLIPKLIWVVDVFFILIELTKDSIQSYKENKRVPSRMLIDDPFMEMELQTHPIRGLIGAKSVLKNKR